MIFGVSPKERPTQIVVFGASGDLARKKVLPALGALSAELPMRIVGAGRSSLDPEQFHDLVGAATGSAELARDAHWVHLDYNDCDSYADLATRVGTEDDAVFYLATPPTTFSPILAGISHNGLAHRGDGRRIVVEKPFGSDLAGARNINQHLGELFEDGQIFRIDHYLAKDTVQNVMALRFSNSLFEPVWNRTMIESIQITAAEQQDIGTRAGYYEGIGATRDMIQNHVLQLLALIAMEPPTTLDPADVSSAKLELLRAVRPLDSAFAVRGQYEGYLDAKGVKPDSRRETYAAAQIAIENWRWEGVPIFLRSGKALRRQLTEVVVRLRDAPALRIGGRRQRPIPTLLVIRFQPDEGITLRIGAKRPGARFEMVPAGMRLEYQQLARSALPDAYENVLAEVLTGGHSLFPSGKEIERCWEIVDPLISAWEAEGHPEIYARGSWGPGAADDLVGGRWIASGDEPGTR